MRFQSSSDFFLRVWLSLTIVPFCAVASEPPTESLANTSASPRVLELNDYLNEVKGQHTGFKGSISGSQASEMRSIEGKLMTLPQLYLNYKFASDAKIPPYSFIQFDHMNSNSFSLGMSELTDFGSQLQFHYDVYSMSYLNVTSGLPLGSLFSNTYFNASPVLEFSQNLWGDGFGRTTRATKDMIEANALASSYGDRYQAHLILSNAEATYWRLSIARQMIAVQNEAVDRARKIYTWTTNRASLHLNEEVEVLQAQAMLSNILLQILSAKNEERSASRAFNSVRNVNSDQVPEALTPVPVDFVEHLEVPKRAALRDDVKSARESAAAARANATVNAEKSLPTLDVFGNIALNGQPGDFLAAPYNGAVTFGQTLGLSFQGSRPSYNLGLRFMMPLAFETAHLSREGWYQEKIAADLKYDRKLFEQEQTWNDLNESFTEAKERLTLAQELESIQKTKLAKEKERYDRGRTTTYYVLVSEQDYLTAQVARIGEELKVLTLISHMKTFGETL